jgi:hypothetical protein
MKTIHSHPVRNAEGDGKSRRKRTPICDLCSNLPWRRHKPRCARCGLHHAAEAAPDVLTFLGKHSTDTMPQW